MKNFSDELKQKIVSNLVELLYSTFINYNFSDDGKFVTLNFKREVNNKLLMFSMQNKSNDYEIKIEVEDLFKIFNGVNFIKK